MINPLNNASAPAPQQLHNAPDTAARRKILRMVENDRTAGSMPSWDYAATPAQKIERDLGLAATGETSSFESALAYSQDSVKTSQELRGQEFGFSDLIDMINPLHHIPVIGHIYRELSGDSIRPIGQVIGGAVFGGPLGAAGGLVNVIVQEETGKDIAENAIALALNGDMPGLKSDSISVPDVPEQRLDNAARYAMMDVQPGDLPGALLAFTDLRHDSGIVIEKAKDVEQRMAGSQPRKDSTSALHPLTQNLTPREPITQVTMPTFPYSIY